MALRLALQNIGALKKGRHGKGSSEESVKACTQQEG